MRKKKHDDFVPDDTGLEIINSTFIPSFIVWEIILEYIFMSDIILGTGDTVNNKKPTPFLKRGEDDKHTNK